MKMNAEEKMRLMRSTKRPPGHRCQDKIQSQQEIERLNRKSGCDTFSSLIGEDVPPRAFMRRSRYQTQICSYTYMHLIDSISLLIGLRLSVQKVMVVQQSILPNDRRTKLWISL
mmetsp:Transcript_12836/g.16413  ORF Transcript_12836/g.16413 Transcript_12836/m.16413 type:complete len:114 (+) Transcript_12836:589-930(+)